MDDVKDKFKGFMKKVSSSSSSSSGKFKGQGRVLGGGSSSSVPSSNPVHARPVNTPGPTRGQTQTQIRAESKPEPSARKEPPLGEGPAPSLPARDGFDPFDSMITSGKRSKNGFSLNVFECPICGVAFRSEDEVSLHVDHCVNGASSETLGGGGNDGGEVDGDESELEGRVGAYMSGNPKEGSVEVVLKLFGNVAKEPGNAKFRRVRMGNPKIREAVTDAPGGVELLEAVGFSLKEEGGEMWAVMEDAPDEGKICVIHEVTRLLERKKVEKEVKTEEVKPSVAAAPIEVEEVAMQKIDRQIRVFFSVPESVAARIELPDTFYKLSLEEVKREADSRKKKMADSQLLIPKSYKEKQAKAARKRYLRTILRIQFPDGVVLQGVFAPWEPTTTLYEFVSSALKDPSLEFELLDPVLVKRRVIPHFAASGKKPPTLDDEGLVPSALIKFRPVESDSSVFTGLCNELLEISEPLS